MAYHWFRNTRATLSSLLVAVLLFVVACGSAAEPTPTTAPDTGAAPPQEP